MVVRPGFLVVVVGLACLLGACTGTDEPDSSSGTIPGTSGLVDGGGSSPSTDNQTSQQRDLPQASWVTEMDPLPPLAAYGVYLDGPGDDPATVTARTQLNDDTQNAIAACMAAQGFRYIPVPAQVDIAATRSRLSTVLRYLPVPYLPDDREMVVRQGYGVMPTVEVQLAAEGMSEDPNVAYTATLSPAEYKAYYSALFGDYNNPGGTSASSCSGKATGQFPAPTESDRQQKFEAEFGDLANVARIDVASDQRTIQLDAEWESCMNRQGFTFDKLEGDHGPTMAMSLALRTRPDGSVGPFRVGVSTSDIPVEEQSLLDTEPERKVAAADFDCRAEADYMDRLTKIRVSLDNQFITEHQAQLDQLVTAAQSW